MKSLLIVCALLGASQVQVSSHNTIHVHEEDSQVATALFKNVNLILDFWLPPVRGSSKDCDNNCTCGLLSVRAPSIEQIRYITFRHSFEYSELAGNMTRATDEYNKLHVDGRRFNSTEYENKYRLKKNLLELEWNFANRLTTIIEEMRTLEKKVTELVYEFCVTDRSVNIPTSTAIIPNEIEIAPEAKIRKKLSQLKEMISKRKKSVVESLKNHNQYIDNKINLDYVQNAIFKSQTWFCLDRFSNDTDAWSQKISEAEENLTTLLDHINWKVPENTNLPADDKYRYDVLFTLCHLTSMDFRTLEALYFDCIERVIDTVKSMCQDKC